MQQSKYGFQANVYNQLKNRNIFRGKKCLDIGTRDGLNCINLIKLGASHVVGIDINDTLFDTVYKPEFTAYSKNIALKKVNLLDLNSNINNSEKYDIITCFLWNMPLPKYSEIIEKIKSLLKNNGSIFIGIHDELYKFGLIDKTTIPYQIKPNTGSVLELISNNFTFCEIIDKSSPYQWIIYANNNIKDRLHLTNSMIHVLNWQHKLKKQTSNVDYSCIYNFPIPPNTM